MLDLSYFNCDLQIAMRDEEAGKDIDNEPPPILSHKQQIAAYKQWCKKYSKTVIK